MEALLVAEPEMPTFGSLGYISTGKSSRWHSWCHFQTPFQNKHPINNAENDCPFFVIQLRVRGQNKILASPEPEPGCPSKAMSSNC